MQLKYKAAFVKKAIKLIEKNPKLKTQTYDTIKILQVNYFDIALKTHKLSGRLQNLWSCHVYTPSHTLALSLNLRYFLNSS